MMCQAHQDLVDPDDFCRACRGKGGRQEKTGRGTRIFEPCHLCRGTGQRTIRVDAIQPCGEPQNHAQEIANALAEHEARRLRELEARAEFEQECG